jgi:transposase
MQVILNKKEKEELVVKLHQQNKTIRQIAEIVHMSFKDIGTIIRRIDGRANDTDLSNKSKATKALWLFERGKRPIEVAIELDIPYTEVEELQQEYWALKELADLALVYYEIRNDLDLFLRLFHVMKKLRLINQKDIQTVLGYAAFDIPYLENRKYILTNEIINLEDKKRNLNQKLVLWNAQLSDLGRAIDSKNQQLKRMDK